MLRKGGAGCCGGHSHSSSNDSSEDSHVHENKTDSNISEIVKDPVCGMNVDTASALSASKYGKTYYFCSTSCKREFTES